MTVDLYFGQRDQLVYKVGDPCVWVPNKGVRKGGRPSGGDLDGEGYTECPFCHRDFFVVVEVRGDVLRGARPDATRSPLIPDDGPV